MNVKDKLNELKELLEDRLDINLGKNFAFDFYFALPDIIRDHLDFEIHATNESGKIIIKIYKIVDKYKAYIDVYGRNRNREDRLLLFVKEISKEDRDEILALIMLIINKLTAVERSRYGGVE